MPAEYTYTDLQLRVLDDAPTATSEDVAMGAVTVENTGDADGVETVCIHLVPAGGTPVEVQRSEEKLEVGHSHRVRFTLDGAALERAGALGAGAHTVTVGPTADDVRAEGSLTLG